MKKYASEIKIGAILSYVQVAAQMGVNFLFLPLLLRMIGQNEYGLYSTATSIVSVLSVLSIGFSSSYVKKYAQYKSSSREDEIAGLNGLYLVIFGVIGLIALVCGLILTANVEVIFSAGEGSGLTSEELERAKILVFLLTVNLSLSFPLSIFETMIGAHERFIFQKLVSVLRVVAGPMLMLPLLFMGFASVGMVWGTIAAALMADAVNLFYCFSKLHIKFGFYGWESGVVKQLIIYMGLIAVNIILEQINWHMDKVIIGRYRGTASVAVYSIGQTVVYGFLLMGQNISNLFMPKVHAIASKYQKNILACAQEFSELFIKVGRVQFLILGLIFSGFLFFGKPFINMWAGSGYENAYYVSVLLMIPIFISLTQAIGVEVQRSLEKHQFMVLFHFGMVVCNLFLSVCFCRIWGEVGSALGTGLALLCVDGLIMGIYYQKSLGIQVLRFWKQIVGMGRGLLLPVGYGLLCGLVWKDCGTALFLAKIGGYVLIYGCSMYLFAINYEERELLKGMAKRLEDILKNIWGGGRV